jgi:hypothetical protein
MPSQELLNRFVRYLSVYREGVKVKERLGGGTDGEVWQTSADTAVKVFYAERGYYNERFSYERLAEFDVTQKLGQFWVPKMHFFNDELLVVEMDIMHHAPYVIDFGKVTLDRGPEYPEDTLRENEEAGLEQFEHNWPAVKTLLRDLESFLIFYLDPRRGNIVFPDMP